MSSNKILDMIGSRAPTPAPADENDGAEENAGVYQAIKHAARAQMGFLVMRVNGDMDGYLYHAINHLKFQTIAGVEFISFTHAGTAITLSGRGLKMAFKLLVKHTLAEFREHDGQMQVDRNAPIIQRIEITQVVPLRPVGPQRAAQ